MRPRFEEHVPVRLSHLLRDCSVGAIVRGPDSLMVVQDIRGWDRPGSDSSEREIRYVDRVRSALGIDRKLRSPPRAANRDGTVVGWIPALRFPTWMRCMQCGLLHRAPWRNSRNSGDQGKIIEAEAETGAKKCSSCGGRLEQTPWVLVHEDGYLADIPWHYLVHKDARNPQRRQCGQDWNRPVLQLIETGTESRIRCNGCGASTIFRSGTLPQTNFPLHTWQQPWIREPPAQSPETPASLMEINDVRVHSPSTRTALVIPPESRMRRGTVTDRLYSSTRNQNYILEARNSLDQRSRIRRLASQYCCTKEQIEDAITEIRNGYPLFGRSVTAGDLLADEFLALTEEIPDLREDEDFVTEHHTQAWKALGRELEDGHARKLTSAVSRVIAVNRLKEIMVFSGFQRANGRLVPPDITGECDWFPAIELYGEGIFFTLDEEILRRWENSSELQQRADAFARRYVGYVEESAPDLEVDVTPRFLLCHTLAHLLIRQFDAKAGYPAASLKERIYCATGTTPMAGVLIYVAVPDEEGSLGGLMELAKPKRFLKLLADAFDAANWCSLDPVCSEQEGHGPGLLNRAACHACALVPETSCAYGNVLLDRAFVKGNGTGIPSILDCVGATR